MSLPALNCAFTGRGAGFAGETERTGFSLVRAVGGFFAGGCAGGCEICFLVDISLFSPFPRSDDLEADEAVDDFAGGACRGVDGAASREEPDALHAAKHGERGVALDLDEITGASLVDPAAGVHLVHVFERLSELAELLLRELLQHRPAVADRAANGHGHGVGQSTDVELHVSPPSASSRSRTARASGTACRTASARSGSPRPRCPRHAASRASRCWPR